MKTFFDTIGKVRTTDLLIVLGLTIPVFLIYVVFTTIYFLIVDKKFHKKENGDYYESHGLSRFCLGGIFFMFGLTLFDMMMEFISAYSVSFINPDIMGKDIAGILNRSLIFNGLCKVFKSVPTDILINFTIVCTAIYTGTEGIIASLRTLKVDAGLAVELPALKRKRLATLFGMWAYLAIISTAYTFLIGSETVKFDIGNVYVALGVTMIILFLAERSPSLLKDQTLQTKILKVSSNGVVKPYNEDDLDDLNKKEKRSDSKIVGDKNDIEKLESTIANFKNTILSKEDDDKIKAAPEEK